MRVRTPLVCLGSLVIALCSSTVLMAQRTEQAISPFARRPQVFRPIEDAAVFDTSPFDGHPDFFSQDGLNAVILNPGSLETRAVVRFDLSAIRGGRGIRQAIFRIGLVGLGYFAVCFPLIVLARRLERRMNAAHAEVQL